MARDVRVSLATLFLLGIILLPSVSAESFRQYDPDRTDEMQKSGLVENISREQYEKEMTALNASMNTTLGCDDYPRCAPVTVPASLSLGAIVCSLVVTLYFLKGVMREP